MDKNPSLSLLKQGYLFPEIAKRVASFQQMHPQADIISLGIGDTTTPFPSKWLDSFTSFVKTLATKEGYKGYGPSEGWLSLREKISSSFYQKRVFAEDIFISDGAKCDISRLQLLFSKNCKVALQDPVYPAYVDSSLLFGKKEIIYLPCTKENDFFPDLSQAKSADLLFINYPNNPTGSMATRENLQTLVDFCKQNDIILIYDAAYSAFIQGSHLPKSIYEIEGAKEIAIEINSFSKMAGFTGVRLGWSVVPKALCFKDRSSVRDSWVRIVNTTFNAPSILSQGLAEAVLDPENISLVTKNNADYLRRGKKLKETLQNLGFCVFGAEHCPYLWVEIKGFKNSWDAFDALLENAHLVTIPGSGFGPAGEGFLRMSAFAKEEQIEHACQRLKRFFS